MTLIVAKLRLRRTKKLMNKKTRRTEIQIETHEVKVIRMSGRQFRAFCEYCEAMAAVFTPDQVAELLQMSPNNALGLVNEGKLHLVRADCGLALICGKSLGDTNNDLMQTASQTNSK